MRPTPVIGVKMVASWSALPNRTPTPRVWHSLVIGGTRVVELTMIDCVQQRMPVVTERRPVTSPALSID